MFKRQKILALMMIFALSMALAACGNQTEVHQDDAENGDANNGEAEEQEKLLIYTSMYPLYYFAQEMAGDRAKVVNLVPAGAEPHDFEPTAKDIIELSNADLFVYNGGGFETWIEKIVEAVNSDTMILVDSTADVQLLTNVETGQNYDEHDDHGHDHDGHDHGKEEDHDHDHGKEEGDHDHDHEDDHAHDHGHDHGEFDPHVWLDPTLAKQQAEAIKNALVEMDAEHAEVYEANFAQLSERFDQLDAQFKALRENVERSDFIVSHSAFGYLAYRYNLNQVAITGLSPTNEPSASKLKEMIEFVNENNIQYILFENLVTPKVAEVVKEEAGVESLVLHNLEGLSKEELSQGMDYFSIMEENLEVLKIALGYEE